MPIRAVLWDIDDTIFDYSGADADALIRHLKAEGRSPIRYEPAERVLGLWRELMEIHYARFAAGELTFRDQRRERVRAFLEEPLDDDEADAWFAAYDKHYRAAWRAFPDVVPALDTLTPGYRHGLLSNAALAAQERKLRALGLRDRFECLVCSSDIGHAKPAPEAFHAACAALGLPPAEVAYVGDRPDIDALGADAAGLFGVWLDRRGTAGGTADGTPSDAPGVRRISGLAELPALLRANTGFGAPTPIG